MNLAAQLARLDADRHQLQLLAIATAIGDRVFTASELLACAELDEDVRYVLAGATTPKQVGRRLRALAGPSRGALRLVCVGRANAGCIWAVTMHGEDGAAIDPDL